MYIVCIGDLCKVQILPDIPFLSCLGRFTELTERYKTLAREDMLGMGHSLNMCALPKLLRFPSSPDIHKPHPAPLRLRRRLQPHLHPPPLKYQNILSLALYTTSPCLVCCCYIGNSKFKMRHLLGAGGRGVGMHISITTLPS